MIKKIIGAILGFFKSKKQLKPFQPQPLSEPIVQEKESAHYQIPPSKKKPLTPRQQRRHDIRCAVKRKRQKVAMRRKHGRADYIFDRKLNARWKDERVTE